LYPVFIAINTYIYKHVQSTRPIPQLIMKFFFMVGPSGSLYGAAIENGWRYGAVYLRDSPESDEATDRLTRTSGWFWSADTNEFDVGPGITILETFEEEDDDGTNFVYYHLEITRYCAQNCGKVAEKDEEFCDGCARSNVAEWWNMMTVLTT
jgi:hypothetical protein